MNIAKYPIATTHINEVKELALIIDKEFNSVRSFIDFMAEKIEYKTFQVLQYYFIEALELEYQQNYSFYAEVDYLERVTDRNIDDNICLTRFLQLRKRAKEIQREREKAKNSKKK